MKTLVKELYADFKMLQRCLELIEDAGKPLNVSDALSNSHLKATKGVLMDSIEEKFMKLLKST